MRPLPELVEIDCQTRGLELSPDLVEEWIADFRGSDRHECRSRLGPDRPRDRHLCAAC